MSPKPAIAVPKQQAASAVQRESIWQVVLHNDDHNTMEHVVLSLMRVFGHSADLAAKIMVEAHERGRAIAEVEAESLARKHRDQLQSRGLIATIESL